MYLPLTQFEKIGCVLVIILIVSRIYKIVHSNDILRKIKFKNLYRTIDLSKIN